MGGTLVGFAVVDVKVLEQKPGKPLVMVQHHSGGWDIDSAVSWIRSRQMEVPVGTTLSMMVTKEEGEDEVAAEMATAAWGDGPTPSPPRPHVTGCPRRVGLSTGCECPPEAASEPPTPHLSFRDGRMLPTSCTVSGCAECMASVEAAAKEQRR